MSLFGEPRLRMRFIVDSFGPVEFEGDPSGVIPASSLGGVVLLTNELVRDTWNYALWFTNDERFRHVRQLEASGELDRRHLELAIVDIRRGSIEITLDWIIAIFGASSILSNLPANLVANALWDMIKYSLDSLKFLIDRETDLQHVQSNSLTNELLPTFVELVKRATTSLPGNQGRMMVDIRYQEPGRSFSILIDEQARERILEANQVEARFSTRLVGTVVGVDYFEDLIGVRWEQFPAQTYWCDARNLNLKKLQSFLPEKPGTMGRRVGFDVELAWRKGAQNLFPPDSIRIIQVVPDHQLGNLKYLDEVSRTPISEMQDATISEAELKFLQWFSWADRQWTNPNLNGIVSYLARSNHILERKLESHEVGELIRQLVQKGIILRVYESRNHHPSNQTLRLNRNHPVVTKYLPGVKQTQ
jgi:hypothetical protein